MRKRHHVVSRGYLRHFASGEQLLLIDKCTSSGKLAGTADTFVVARFCSILTELGWTDEIENDWCRIENQALPGVRRLVSGERSLETTAAAKALAAVHFARSFGLRDVFARVTADFVTEAPKSIAQSRQVREGFRADHGRDPQPGEIEAIAATMVRERLATNRLFVEQMANMYNRAIEHFEPLELQILRPWSGHCRFVTGEVPLVHFDTTALNLGVRSGLALLDADHVYMPLAPTAAIMLTTKREPDAQCPPVIVKQMNRLIWRASPRFVACHPDDDPTACVAISIRRK